MSEPLLFVDTSESNVTGTGNLHVTNHVGIGTDNPGSLLSVQSTSGNQIRLNYNDAYYNIIERDPSGNLNFGERPGSGAVNTHISMKSGGNVDISGNLDVGGVITSDKPAFYAWDNITSRSGTTLTFNSTTYNTGSHYNTSTSRFRTPVAGTYIFAAVLAHDYNNTFGSAYYSFYVDGSNHRDILEGMPTHDAHYEKHGVYIVYLNANQYVDIRSRSNHNITFVNGNHGAYYRNCFQGALLG